MSHIYLFLLQCYLHLSRQTQQSQIVGYGSAALSDAFGHLLLCHSIGVEQVFVRQRNLNGVEIFALYILDECHFHDVFVVDSAYVCRNGSKSGHLRGSPASFTGYYLESVFVDLS